MEEYSIYWINEEVARNYFHKSDILYRFLVEYENNPNRVDLRKQYNYITNRFSIDILISHLRSHLKNIYSYRMKDSFIEISTTKQCIALHIGEKRLKFRSGSIQEAEELLFPILRRYQLYLFVIGNTINNYGWISPLKLSSVKREKQVLYSWQ
ncbi:sporulation inhibitor of replication protein SirA [Oceanobacillus piezotolerans]|uniref:Sporulation inhibitor of replication protein SirA n=1 Tax=Oceanobacillus piezotolerans TaxID=2448030 RepID=A0A498DIS2_9BACI|nr:sporulation inhibitor of replication protein SirA [Oceanobacillus piezotolerans]RLL45405.1 sporulation inhibitor of replication protein SirA [Oceanobacillus piezotolerans]